MKFRLNNKGQAFIEFVVAMVFIFAIISVIFPKFMNPRKEIDREPVRAVVVDKYYEKHNGMIMAGKTPVATSSTSYHLVYEYMGIELADTVDWETFNNTKIGDKITRDLVTYETNGRRSYDLVDRY